MTVLYCTCTTRQYTDLHTCLSFSIIYVPVSTFYITSVFLSPPVSSLFTDAIVIVLDTDYTSFSALLECSNMRGIRMPRRTKGTILSRTPTLDPAIVEMVGYSMVQLYLFWSYVTLSLNMLIYLHPSLPIQLRLKLADASVNVERLNRISHSNCPEEPDLVIRPSDWFDSEDEWETSIEGSVGAETNSTETGSDVNPEEYDLL